MSSINRVLLWAIVLWLHFGGTALGACGQILARPPDALRSTDSGSAQTLAAGEAETSEEASRTVEDTA